MAQACQYLSWPGAMDIGLSERKHPLHWAMKRKCLCLPTWSFIFWSTKCFLVEWCFRWIRMSSSSSLGLACRQGIV
jgi:hypothetical protein